MLIITLIEGLSINRRFKSTHIGYQDMSVQFNTKVPISEWIKKKRAQPLNVSYSLRKYINS